MDVKKARDEINLAKVRIKGCTASLNKAWFSLEMALSHLEPGPTGPVFLNNPAKLLWPGDDAKSCYWRGVWDMAVLGEFIYGGSGDIVTNPGRSMVWCTDKDGGATYEVFAEEQVATIKRFGRILYAPGADPMGSRNGAVYTCLGSGGWLEYPELPGAIHVTDIVRFEKGAVYVLATYRSAVKLLRSMDYDLTDWHEVAIFPFNGQDMVHTLGIMGERLVAFGRKDGEDCLYALSGGLEALEVLHDDPYGNVPRFKRAARVVSFGDGILYIPHLSYDAPVARSANLFFADAEEVRRVHQFDGETIRDIIVDGDTAYVLTYIDETEFGGRICSMSVDTSFGVSEVCKFTVPALPYSFERLGDAFFIGLGGRRGEVDHHSGDVWMVRV